MPTHPPIYAWEVSLYAKSGLLAVAQLSNWLGRHRRWMIPSGGVSQPWRLRKDFRTRLKGVAELPVLPFPVWPRTSCYEYWAIATEKGAPPI